MLLTKDDRDRIEIFKQRVQNLRDSRLLNTAKVTFKVSRGLGAMEDPETPFEDYDEEQFRSFLQTFRQFTLSDEPAYFYCICNLIEKHCGDDNLKAWERHARASWRAIWAQNSLSYSLSGEQITVEKAFSLLLYEGITHTDLDKWRKLSSLPTGARGPLYWIVQRSLGDLFQCLRIVDSVIFYWIDSPGQPVPTFEEPDT